MELAIIADYTKLVLFIWNLYVTDNCGSC